MLLASSSRVFSSSLRICIRDGHSSTMTTSGRTLRMTCRKAKKLGTILYQWNENTYIGDVILRLFAKMRRAHKIDLATEGRI